VHCVHAARQLVDVRLNDFAVVHRDWGVGDDFVVHGWFGLRWLKDCALASRTPRWVRSCSRSSGKASLIQRIGV